MFLFWWATLVKARFLFFCMNLLFDKFVATSAMLVCNPAFVHVPRFGLAFYWTLWLGRRSMKSFVHVFFPMSDLGQVSQFRGNPRIQKARTNNNEWTRLACCTGHQYIINRIMIIITTNAMNTIAACKMIKKHFPECSKRPFFYTLQTCCNHET